MAFNFQRLYLKVIPRKYIVKKDERKFLLNKYMLKKFSYSSY